MPALELPTPPEAAPIQAANKAPAKPAPLPARPPLKPLVSVEVRDVTLSPDKSRALTRVVFEDPTAMAFYDIVLQKHNGNWTIASVWLGPEVERPQPAATHPASELTPH